MPRRRVTCRKWKAPRSAAISTTNAYGAAFREDHLYPMTAAIWSIPARQVADYPAQAFTRFCENHGLAQDHGPTRLAHGRWRQPRICEKAPRRLSRIAFC